MMVQITSTPISAGDEVRAPLLAAAMAALDTPGRPLLIAFADEAFFAQPNHLCTG
jgi:hypothetical protein